MPWPAFWTCSCFLPTLLLLLCSSLCPMFCPCLCPLAAFFHVWFSGFLCCLQCQGHPVWLHEFLHVLHEGLRLLQVSWKGLCLKAKTLAAAGSPESHSSASLDGKMFKKTVLTIRLLPAVIFLSLPFVCSSSFNWDQLRWQFWKARKQKSVVLEESTAIPRLQQGTLGRRAAFLGDSFCF